MVTAAMNANLFMRNSSLVCRNVSKNTFFCILHPQPCEALCFKFFPVNFRLFCSRCQGMRMRLTKTSDRCNLYSPVYGRSVPTKRSYVVDSQTQVACDVLIYQYKHDRFFKFLTFFAIAQGSYFGQLAWYGLRDAHPVRPLPEGSSWMTRLIAGRLSYGSYISLFLGGCGKQSFGHSYV